VEEGGVEWGAVESQASKLGPSGRCGQASRGQACQEHASQGQISGERASQKQACQ